MTTEGTMNSMTEEALETEWQRSRDEMIEQARCFVIGASMDTEAIAALAKAVPGHLWGSLETALIECERMFAYMDELDRRRSEPEQVSSQ